MPTNKRFSSEFTMLTILEYLVLNSRSTPLSKYHISTKVEGIKQQRRDRVTNMMDILERKGFVKSIATPSAIFYQITDSGIRAYMDWVKPFLDFTRETSGQGISSQSGEKAP